MIVALSRKNHADRKLASLNRCMTDMWMQWKSKLFKQWKNVWNVTKSWCAIFISETAPKCHFLTWRINVTPINCNNLGFYSEICSWAQMYIFEKDAASNEIFRPWGVFQYGRIFAGQQAEEFRPEAKWNVTKRLCNGKYDWFIHHNVRSISRHSHVDYINISWL